MPPLMIPVIAWLAAAGIGLTVTPVVRRSQLQQPDRAGVSLFKPTLTSVVHVGVTVGEATYQCTGWVSGRNQVITASHCLGKDPARAKVEVTFVNKRRAEFKLVVRGDYDRDADVAVLRGDTGKVPPLRIARSASLPHLCLYVSSNNKRWRVLPCVALGTSVNVADQPRLLVQSEPRLGDSGAPVIGRKGEVISMMIEQSEYNQFMGYGEVLRQIRDTKTAADLGRLTPD